VLAELLGRNPLFPGKDYLDQIRRIIYVLGTPTDEEMSFVATESAIKYIKSLPKHQRINWATMYPNANPVSLDLLGHMLEFKPDVRYTVEECLGHKYFESLYNREQICVSETQFDWSWDHFDLKKELMQTMIYEMSLEYNPL